jgi:N-acetylneuraminic acid mutarotase
MTPSGTIRHAPSTAARASRTTRHVARGLALAIAGLVSLATLLPVTAQAAQTWTGAANTAVPHWGAAAVAGGDGRLYVVGSASNPSTVEAYTPSSNSWATVASLAHGRYDIGAAKGADGRIYAVGGYDVDGCGCYSTEANAYNTGTNAWATVAAMPVGRIFPAVAATSDGKVVVFGGYTTTGSTNRVDIYTPSTNRWTSGAAMPTPRYGATAVTNADGNIYVIGGYQDGVRVLDKVEMYNPTANTWTTRAAMPTPRYQLAGALGTDGKIYAIGGTNDTGFFATVEAYDPSSNTWTTAPPMPTARYGLGAATLGGRIYAVGGRGVGGDLKKNEYLSGSGGVTPPSGTVTINGGAATTNSLTVSLAVPASGGAAITTVAISNSGATSGGLLSTTRTYAYTTPISWDLSDAATGGTSATGTHTVYAQWKDANNTWSAVASDSIDYETAPVPQPVTNLQADTSVPGQVALSWTNPGTLAGDIVRRADASTCPVNAGDGTPIGGTTVRASEVDATGTPGTAYCWSVFTTDGTTNSVATSVVATVPVDTGGGGSGPVISGINNKLNYTPVTGGKVPVQTTWVGTDSDDTIASYQAQMQTNGGAWTNVTLAHPTSTDLTVNLTPGSTYNFQIRGTDAHGHVGAWAQGIAFVLNGYQQTAATYSGTWSNGNLAGSWGGTVKFAKASGASASITFTGRNLAFVSTLGPTYGAADVYVDGIFWKSIDMHNAKVTKALIEFRWSTGLLTNQTHTIRIVNQATTGHPRIDIDGFVSFQSV